jgi:hypothetical protein
MREAGSRYLTRRQHLAFGAGIGGLMGVATGLGENSFWWGAYGFLIVFGFSLITTLLPKDKFELMHSGDPQDERQVRLNTEAVELSAYAMGMFALCGSMWEMAHGRDSVLMYVCVVGGASFLLAQLILPKVR